MTSLYPTIRQALHTSWWLISLMVPVSLGVTILDLSGGLALLASWLNPLFNLLGMRGEGALVFLTGMFLNIYSAIAVITSLSLDAREITILALMCLISHNLITEILILKKTGSNPWSMLTLRIGTSIVGAVILNYLLPDAPYTIGRSNAPAVADTELLQVMKDWFIRTFFLCIKVLGFVTGLMVLQKLLEIWGVLDILTKAFSPVVVMFGLPKNSAFLWIVANILGLGYGAAIMIDWKEKGKISREDNDLLNHHIAISHSLLEDTLLFLAIGVSAFWITVPRLVLAFVIVWCLRLLRYRAQKQDKFKLF